MDILYLAFFFLNHSLTFSTQVYQAAITYKTLEWREKDHNVLVMETTSDFTLHKGLYQCF